MKKSLFLLLGVCLIMGGCNGKEAKESGKSEKATSNTSKVEKKQEKRTNSEKKMALPLSLAADQEGVLPEKNGSYVPYLTISVPETYGCLIYNTIFAKTNSSGETVADVHYSQGAPVVKEWMQKEENERYAGMPYSYVFCLDESNRSSWFSYTLISEENLKRMEGKYPDSDFELYTPQNREKMAMEMTIKEDEEKFKVLKQDKGEGQAAGLNYTYDYLMVQDEEKERSIHCDYEFDVGENTTLYYSVKAYESEMKLSNFDPKNHGEEVAEGIKLEQGK